MGNSCLDFGRVVVKFFLVKSGKTSSSRNKSLFSSLDLIINMGACCSKLGSYMIRKDEAKTVSNGGTPRLNKLEHVNSFVSSPNKASVEKENGSQNNLEQNAKSENLEDIKTQPNVTETPTRQENTGEGPTVDKTVENLEKVVEPIKTKVKSPDKSSSSSSDSSDNEDKEEKPKLSEPVEEVIVIQREEEKVQEEAVPETQKMMAEVIVRQSPEKEVEDKRSISPTPSSSSSSSSSSEDEEKAEEEAKRKAELEAQLKAEEEAKLKAEEEAKIQAELEAQ